MKSLDDFTRLLIRMALLGGLALVAPACSQQEEVEPKLNSSAENSVKSDKTKTFYGPAVPMGQGVGRAWVMANAAGNPTSIGVEVSAKSVFRQGDEPIEYTFQLPKQVPVPPFDHIELGWNPNGHEPEGIYTSPHFDLHFYMITSAFQATIPFLAPPAFDAPVPSQYFPSSPPSKYFMTPGLVPNMGAHLVDLLSPEFQPGGTFTKTFIYGSYQGNITFLEPMFTLEYLRALATGAQTIETAAIPQPAAFQRAGYYPTSYTISYDNTPKQYTISLNNLLYHPAH